MQYCSWARRVLTFFVWDKIILYLIWELKYVGRSCGDCWVGYAICWWLILHIRSTLVWRLWLSSMTTPGRPSAVWFTNVITGLDSISHDRCCPAVDLHRFGFVAFHKRVSDRCTIVSGGTEQWPFYILSTTFPKYVLLEGIWIVVER